APSRIASRSEDNGKGPGRLLGGQGADCGSGHDDINVERNQFGRKSGEPLDLPLGISVFDHDVAALDVTEVTQSLTEGLLVVGVSGPVDRQIAYSSDLGRLLSAPSDWPRCRASNKRNELPPPHSMTSSARASSDGDTVSPRAFAVLRLIT